MTASTVVPWSGTPGLLSEGPRWHEERQELLWVDILGRHIHRGTLAADGSLDEVTKISLDRHVGAVAPALGGGYVVAAGPGFLCSSTMTDRCERWPSPRPAGPTCG